MRSSKRFKTTATALIAVGAVGVCAGNAGAAPLSAAKSSAVKTVLVKDDFFSPRKMTVPKNTTLNFVWRGNVFHNVAIGRKVVLPNRITGEGAIPVSRSVVFVCTLHRLSGMKLQVTVR